MGKSKTNDLRSIPSFFSAFLFCLERIRIEEIEFEIVDCPTRSMKQFYGASSILKRIFLVLFCFLLVPTCQSVELNAICDPNAKGYFTNLLYKYFTSDASPSCGYQIQNFGLAKPKVPRFLLVSNASSSSISVFRITPETGTISQVSGSPFAVNDSPRYTVVNASGTIVYAALSATPALATLSLNPETGSLSTLFSNTGIGNNPYSLALNPDGTYLYVSTFSGPTIYGLKINGTGSLTYLTSYTTNNPSGGSTGDLMFDPSSNYLYVGLTSALGNTGGIEQFQIDRETGVLTSLNVYNTGQNNLGVTISSNGKFLFGANYYSNDVYAFSRDLGNGNLVSQGNIAAVSAPGNALVERTDRFLYVANSASGQGTISGYVINQSFGTLTNISGSPFTSGQSPNGIASDPNGKFLYSANTLDNNVSGFTIHPETGSLTLISGFPVAVGNGPSSVTVVSY